MLGLIRHNQCFMQDLNAFAQIKRFKGHVSFAWQRETDMAMSNKVIH